MIDDDLIRRGDARDILSEEGWLERSLERIKALPAVTVGVKPLVWVEDFADHPFGWYETIDCGDCIVLTQSGVTLGSFPTLDAAKAAAQADSAQLLLNDLARALDADFSEEGRKAVERWSKASDAAEAAPTVMSRPTPIQMIRAALQSLALITEKPHDRA